HRGRGAARRNPAAARAARPTGGRCGARVQRDHGPELPEHGAVQIMGLLETRALDFDHVIILSCNENALPAPKRQNSLFPYDVLTEFKLPTYADAEATAAYNFWRLLQRTGRVDLVHVLPGAEGVRTGERSRFLRQLEFDLAAQNPQLVVEDKVVGVPSELGVLSSELGVDAPELKTQNSELKTASDLVLEKDELMLTAL
nr:hypothetical protein [Tanacetum cinerariifolium]